MAARCENIKLRWDFVRGVVVDYVGCILFVSFAAPRCETLMAAREHLISVSSVT